MNLARPNSDHTNQPRLRTRALAVDRPFLYSATKRLFPRMPRVVREHKMRVLCLVALLVLGMCLSLAVGLWLLAARFPPT